MYCASCGTFNQDGAHFCQNCGKALQAPGAALARPPIDPYPIMQQEEERLAPRQAPSIRSTNATRSSRSIKPKDPYQNQIKQLKLELKQIRLYLKQITTKMSSTRSQYYETAAFVPEGLLRKGYKWFEDMRLLGPQQQKQQLQQQVMQLEQQLIGLQQAQMQWKMQQEQLE